jgi:type IV pilus assembly protein PilX
MKNIQKGSSLLFTLIVLVAMLFGTISLFKSVNISTVIAGNLAFKESSINASDIAIADAEIVLQTKSTSNGLENDTTTGYGLYYHIQRKTDVNGIVCSSLLVTNTTDTCNTAAMSWGSAKIIGNNKIYYIIDRLCNDTINLESELNTKCMIDTQHKTDSNISGSSEYNPPKLLAISYRVTIKVIGPNHTESFIQTTISQS